MTHETKIFVDRYFTRIHDTMSALQHIVECEDDDRLTKTFEQMNDGVFGPMRRMREYLNMGYGPNK